MPRLLIDLSAWARSSHPAVQLRWAELVNGDQLVCHPVFAVELLHNSLTPAHYAQLRRDLDEGFDWLWPDERTAEVAMRLQARMATAAACGQRVKTADLLIAALAVQHGLGVLHYDDDYDLILRNGGETFDSEWLAPKGTLQGESRRSNEIRKAYRKALGERMVQFRDGQDLAIWPGHRLMDERLRENALPVPPPPSVPSEGLD